ncbi:hypothetical protein QFW96_12640 [Saccharopolyspora sp. TS4A08]|uniref:Uncharacterized protein n=1 Tax=Saccharopolyspora ipomoeae TaxID=3042027 RepID=A0ABT6PNF7_9PSEU|nr:hypothetical protein [Saccharopolyspora sp. TS4A08]MDI2029469.1 hypothetical protein [Saccharopolyspora sp. TS4A08]
MEPAEPSKTTRSATATLDGAPTAEESHDLPTAPCSVVWSGGHSYVREGSAGARWAGVDDRGRARFLTDAELRRRGWSRTRD